MRHSLLCYVIRALNNDQPNGCAKGKCGWILVSGWNLCGGSSGVQTPPWSHFLYWCLPTKRADTRLRLTVTCVCPKTRNQPACCVASLNQLFWVLSNLSFSHSRRICSDRIGEALGAAAAAAAVVVRPVRPVLPLQHPCCLQAPDGMSAQRSPNEIRE